MLLVAVSFWVAETWHAPASRWPAGDGRLRRRLATGDHRRRCRTSESCSAAGASPFFLSWSLSLIVFITIAAGLDAGVRSPVVLMLFLTLVYAALVRTRGWLGRCRLARSRCSPCSSSARWAAPATGASDRSGVPRRPHAHPGGHRRDVRLAGAASSSRPGPSSGGCRARTRSPVASTGSASTSEWRGAEPRVAPAISSGCARAWTSTASRPINDEPRPLSRRRAAVLGGAAMRDVLRPGTRSGRLGGDEFAALLPGAGPAEARQVADRLRARPLGAGSEPVPVWPAQPRTASTPSACTTAADERAVRAPSARGRRSSAVDSLTRPIVPLGFTAAALRPPTAHARRDSRPRSRSCPTTGSPTTSSASATA